MKCFTHSLVLCLFWVGFSSQNSLEAAKRFDHDSTDEYTLIKKGLRKGLVSLRQRSYIKGTFEDAYETPNEGNVAKSQIRKREATINKMLSSINLNLFNPNNAHGEFKREVHYSGSAALGDNKRMKRQAEEPGGGSDEQPPPRKGGRGGRRGRRGRGCNCKKDGGKGGDTSAEPKGEAAEGGGEEKRRKRELSTDEGESLFRVRRQDDPEGGEEPLRNGDRGGGRNGGRRGGRGGRGRRCRCPKPGDKKASDEPGGEAPADDAGERKKRETVAGPVEKAPRGKSGVSPRRLYYAPEARIKHRPLHVGYVLLVHHRHRPSSNMNHGRELVDSNVINKVENSDRKKREDTVSEVAEDKSVDNPESPHKKDKKRKHFQSHHLKRLYSMKYNKKTVTGDSKSSNMDEKVDRKKREADEEDDDESKEKVASSGTRSIPGDKDTPGCYGRWKYGGGGGGGGAGAGADAGGGAEAGGEVGEYKKAAKYKKAKGKKKSKG